MTDTMDIVNFDGRLNLSGFTNLQKGISQTEFVDKYLKDGKYEVFTEKQLATFYKALNDELQKGVTDVDGLKFANKELGSLQQVKLTNGDKGEYISVYVREKQISTTETLEKSADADGVEKTAIEAKVGEEVTLTDEGKDNLEKGAVTDSFGSYNGNKLSFTKTGKEIKEQITSVLLPALNAQKTVMTAQLLEVAKTCGENTPDQPLSNYYYKGFGAVLPKMMTYSYKNCESEWDDINKCRLAQTDEQKACNLYNELVYQIIGTAADIEYCGVLSRNLKDGAKFELTPDQIMSLQF